MNQKEFTDVVKRTESPQFNISLVNPRLLHAVMGLSTESNELLDALKKTIFYGKQLDLVNLEEEGADIAYYLFLMMDSVGIDWDIMLNKVKLKLEARYPEKFTTDNALNRDLEKERKILENN